MQDSQRVLIADEQQSFVTVLSMGFKQLGFAVIHVESVADIVCRAREFRPHLAVSEQCLSGGTWRDAFLALKEQRISIPWVIATASGSIAAAVAAIRAGAAAYLAKPVTASDVVSAITGSEPVATPTQSRYCSLERAKWEYINRTVQAAGSISEAARRLNVERRSLRRMLARHPPAR